MSPSSIARPTRRRRRVRPDHHRRIVWIWLAWTIGVAVVAALALTLLSSCTPRQETVAEDVEGAGPPPADSLAPDQWTNEAVGTQQTDRQLVALGNEPFWNVRVAWREILYTDPEHLDGYRFEPTDASRDGDTLVYTTRREVAAGEAGPREMVLRVWQGACSDGMSDKQYPMMSRLTMGDVQHTGCAEYRTSAQVSER